MIRSVVIPRGARDLLYDCFQSRRHKGNLLEVSLELKSHFGFRISDFGLKS